MMLKLLCFLLITQQTQAFLNIESLRQANVEDGLKGSSRISLMSQKGNVNKSLYNFSTLARFKKSHDTFLFLADYQYGESFSVLDNRQGHLHFRYGRTLSNRFTLEAFQQSEFNKFQDLNLRLLLGAGLRTKIIKDDELSLFIGSGAFYEREKLSDGTENKNPRGNFYLSAIWQKEEEYSFSSTLYYQPNTEDIDDRRTRFNVGLETYFGKNFTQSIEFSWQEDTRAPAGVKATDSILRAGIGVNY